MHEARRNLVVGLFVLAGLTALGTLIVLFGQEPTWLIRGKQYVLNAHFESARGIRPGTIVTVSGIDVGRVLRVEFRDPQRFDLGASVVLTFDEGYRFRRGTFARTNEPGIGAGRPPIMLIPTDEPEAPYLESGATIKGEMVPAVDALFPPAVRANFERAALQIGDAAEALTPVLEDLHNLMQPLDPETVDRPGGPNGNVATVVVRLDAAIRHLNDVLGDPAVRSNLKATIDNIYAMSEDGKATASDLKQFASDAREVAGETKTLVSDAQTTVRNLDEHMERISRDLRTNLELMSRVLDSLNAVAAATAAGEGTVGRLVRDERLYESMLLTFRRLAETVEEFRLLVKQWQEGKVRVAL